uniref:Uncharacterized protein n=1 Tax=Corethron hystrix TaxID=216773 RepID=A0A7S1FLV7_9STRA|mmetsp:Transcript_12278/g.26870  ORF Transcript_12278/g.26870 Transcript_12278/m.26870 type:complete len:259 (+) Transcript_12278:805-1581(+)
MNGLSVKLTLCVLAETALLALFFRKHGCTDLHQKAEKKYHSKAAQLYRVQISKMVEAEAAKIEGRGVTNEKVVSEPNEEAAMNKLSFLAALPKPEKVANPTLQPVASRPGTSGKLNVGGLRKPTMSSSMKPSPSNGSMLRKPTAPSISRLVMKPSAARKIVTHGSNLNAGSVKDASDDIMFESVEATQQAVAKANEEVNRNLELDDSTKALLEKLNKVKLKSESPAKQTDAATVPPKASMEDSLAKLKGITNDFFAQM